jgi:very-short-patch-repair endonuclease
MAETDGIRARGGLAATHELLRDGSTSHRLTALTRAGTIVRVRQGWYGMPDRHDELEQAVRVGGRATSTTAARALGLAVMPDPVLHVRVDPHASRLRDPIERRRLTSGAQVCVHWRAGGSGTRHRMSASAALVDMAACRPIERVVAAADSAIRLGLLTRTGWRSAVRGLPRGSADLAAEVDARSESILESIMRFRLRRLGFRPEVQARIDGVGRVDLLLGRVVIELDGWEHHRDRDAFEADRRRDDECVRRGLIPLRFSARQLLRNWQWVRSIVEDCARL